MTDTEAEAAPHELPPIISSYAATHCANCAAGWVRHGTKGGMIIVCLLDRKAVWHDLAECDRYAPRTTDAPPEA